jgi:hypothetical protein
VIGGVLSEFAYGTQQVGTGNLLTKTGFLYLGNRDSNDRTFNGLFCRYGLLPNANFTPAQKLRIAQLSGF